MQGRYPRRLVDIVSPRVGVGTADPCRGHRVRRTVRRGQDDTDAGEIRAKVRRDQATAPTREIGGETSGMTEEVADAPQIEFDVRISAFAEDQEEIPLVIGPCPGQWRCKQRQ